MRNSRVVLKVEVKNEDEAKNDVESLQERMRKKVGVGIVVDMVFLSWRKPICCIPHL